MPSVKSMPKAAKNKKAIAKEIPPMKKSEPQTLSTEYIQDSESEEDESSDSNSTSDDGSLPDNPASSIPKENSKANTHVNQNNPPSDSEDESGIEDESTSQQSEPEQVPSPMEKRKRIVSPDHQRQPQKLSSTSVSVDKPVVYSPPSGFVLASVDETPRISQQLKGSNLEGKEIWYITAPASVPVSSIEDLSLKAIQERKVILSQNGDDYALMADTSDASESTKVMIPKSSDGGYHIGKHPISRILHIRQTIPRAKFVSQVTTPAEMPVREQPPGLKMRFHPIGFDAEPRAEFRRAGSISSSSESSEDIDHVSGMKTTALMPPLKSGATPKAFTTKSTKSNSSSGKRKHSEGENQEPKHSSSKSANIFNNRKLKIIKTQVENQETTSSQSMSTEAQPITSTIFPPKAQTRILPPNLEANISKYTIAPPPSLSASIEPHGLDSQIQAIEPSLTTEERKKESKSLRRRDSSVSKSKKREEKSYISSRPSSKHKLTSEEPVISGKGADGKQKKRRRTEQMANGGEENVGAAEWPSTPRSTAPILPPKYTAKR